MADNSVLRNYSPYEKYAGIVNRARVFGEAGSIYPQTPIERIAASLISFAPTLDDVKGLAQMFANTQNPQTNVDQAMRLKSAMHMPDFQEPGVQNQLIGLLAGAAVHHIGVPFMEGLVGDEPLANMKLPPARPAPPGNRVSYGVRRAGTPAGQGQIQLRHAPLSGPVEAQQWVQNLSHDELLQQTKDAKDLLTIIPENHDLYDGQLRLAKMLDDELNKRIADGQIPPQAQAPPKTPDEQQRFAQSAQELAQEARSNRVFEGMPPHSARVSKLTPQEQHFYEMNPNLKPQLNAMNQVERELGNAVNRVNYRARVAANKAAELQAPPEETMGQKLGPVNLGPELPTWEQNKADLQKAFDNGSFEEIKKQIAINNALLDEAKGKSPGQIAKQMEPQMAQWKYERDYHRLHEGDIGPLPPMSTAPFDEPTMRMRALSDMNLISLATRHVADTYAERQLTQQVIGELRRRGIIPPGTRF